MSQAQILSLPIPIPSLSVLFFLNRCTAQQRITQAAGSGSTLHETTLELDDISKEEEEVEEVQQYRLNADSLRWRPSAKREFEESLSWLSDTSLEPWVHRLPSGVLFSVQHKGGGIGVYTDPEDDANGLVGERDDEDFEQGTRNLRTTSVDDKDVEKLVWDDARARKIEQTLGGVDAVEDYIDYDRSPVPESLCLVSYKVFLRSGQMIMATPKASPATLRPSQVISAAAEALQLMRIGDRWTVWAPPHTAYGEHGAGSAIPPNAALKLELELLTIDNESPVKPAHEASERLKGLIGVSYDKIQTEEEVMKDPSNSQYILMLRNYGQDVTPQVEPLDEGDDYDPVKDEDGNPLPDAWADTRGRETDTFLKQKHEHEDKYEDPWARPFAVVSRINSRRQEVFARSERLPFQSSGVDRASYLPMVLLMLMLAPLSAMLVSLVAKIKIMKK